MLLRENPIIFIKQHFSINLTDHASHTYDCKTQWSKFQEKNKNFYNILLIDDSIVGLSTQVQSKLAALTARDKSLRLFEVEISFFFFMLNNRKQTEAFKRGGMFVRPTVGKRIWNVNKALIKINVKLHFTIVLLYFRIYYKMIPDFKINFLLLCMIATVFRNYFRLSVLFKSFSPASNFFFDKNNIRRKYCYPLWLLFF